MISSNILIFKRTFKRYACIFSHEWFTPYFKTVISTPVNIRNQI